MRKIALYLVVVGPYQHPPACYQAVERLGAQYELSLCLIHNGTTAHTPDEITPPGLQPRCRVTLPFVCDRLALMKWLLPQMPRAADYFLWLESNVIWNPDDLEAWFEPLSNTAWVQPTRLKQGHPREAQALSQAGATIAEAHTVNHRAGCCLWRHSEQFLQSAQGRALPQAYWQPDEAPALAAVEPVLTTLQTQPRLAPELLQDILRQSPTSARIWEAHLPNLAQAEIQPALQQALAQGALSLPLVHMLHQQAPSPHLQQVLSYYFQQPQAAPFGSQTASAGLPQRASLSVCLIIRNEAEVLSRCLASVAPLADEIIVVDTGSSDSSRDIAHQFGARLIDWPWQDDFAAARNVSLAAATQDWILVIDADEYLPPDSQTILEAFLWHPFPGLPRCQVRIDNRSEEPDKDYSHYLTRLFPRHADLRYHYPIHERLAYHGPGHSPKIALTQLVLVHTGYQQQVYQQKHKAARNLALLQRQVVRDPQEPRWWFHLADALISQQDYLAARDTLKRALSLWQARDMLARQSLYQLTLLRFLEVLCLTGDTTAFEQHFEQNRTLLEKIPDYWYLGALYYQAADQADEALVALQGALSCQPHLAELSCQHTPAYAGKLAQAQQIMVYRHTFLKGDRRFVKTCLQQMPALLAHYPNGKWQAQASNLYSIYGEAIILTQQAEGSLSLDLKQIPYTPTSRLCIDLLQWLLSGHPLELPSWPANMPPDLGGFVRHQWQHYPEQRLALDWLLNWLQILQPHCSLSLLLAQLYQHSDQPLESLRIVEEGLVRYPQDPYLRQHKIQLLYQLGDLPLAQAEQAALQRQARQQPRRLPR
jgi:tetratricopeptide (TPR) repeat protein